MTDEFRDAVFFLKGPYARIKQLAPVDKDGLVTIVIDTNTATFLFPGEPTSPEEVK